MPSQTAIRLSGVTLVARNVRPFASGGRGEDATAAADMVALANGAIAADGAAISARLKVTSAASDSRNNGTKFSHPAFIE